MIKLDKQMNRTNTALIVIDVNNGCCHQKCEIPEWNISFSKIRNMVPQLVGFISSYQANINDHILYTTTVPWKAEHLPDNINRLYEDPEVTYRFEDDAGFRGELHKVDPQRAKLVVAKDQYDVFTNSELRTYLESNKIEYIVPTGVFGDGCVMASICGGFSLGYNFIILEDLIETTDVEIRQELLSRLKTYTWPHMFGKVMKSQELLQLLV